MDYLKQLTKEMSWYKMNDLQIHLNDNLIPLEDYTKHDKNVFDAYSAFRLESDVKEGGNGIFIIASSPLKFCKYSFFRKIAASCICWQRPVLSCGWLYSHSFIL